MAHQGQNRTREPGKDRQKEQGPKTREKNREMAQTGSKDQGTQ